MLSVDEEIMTTSDESSSSVDDVDQREFPHHQPALSREDTERINALKNLQISYNRLESCYLKSVHELEYAFSQQCSHLFEQRADIINGKYEPTDEQCRLKTDFIESNEKSSSSNDGSGIPSFWLQTLKQVPMMADMIEEWDEPILRCLSDIKLSLQIEPIQAFTIEFHFNEGCKEYFHNEILTKFYELQIEPDEDEVLFYEGTAIVRSVGCTIDWIDSRTDVTRNQQTNEFQESFFHFFTTPSAINEWKLANDFQIGHYLREHLVPKAILYYTGEIFEEDNNNDDDDDEQEIPFTEQQGGGEH